MRRLILLFLFLMLLLPFGCGGDGLPLPGADETYAPVRSSVYFVIASDAPNWSSSGPTDANVWMCDGTDDDVPIQAAVDAASLAGTLGGGLVDLSLGSFSIETLITIPSNVTVRGAGWNTVLRVAAGADVGVFKNADPSGGNSNIVVENLRVEGNKANQGAAACRGVWFSKVTRGRVSGVWANDFQGAGATATRGIGIYIDNSSYIIVENCYASDNLYDNISVRNGSAHCVVTNCVATAAVNGQGIQVYDADDHVISGNVCQDNGQNGITVHRGSRINILGNLCYSNDQSGIRILSDASENSSECNVSGNTCNDNTWYGINLDRSGGGETSNCLVNGNVVFENTLSGIFVDSFSDRITINDNFVYLNVQHGIRVEGGSYYIISGNHCRRNGNTFHDIAMLGNHSIITNNLCVSTGGMSETGIYLSNADYTVVQGNRTTGHDTAGLQILDTCNDISVGGNLFTDVPPIINAGTQKRFDVVGAIIATPAADQVRADDSAILITGTLIRVVGNGGAAVLDTAPAIVDGPSDGALIIIQGTSDGNTVQITDNVNTQLVGNVAVTLADGDMIAFVWDAGDSDWYELYRVAH